MRKFASRYLTGVTGARFFRDAITRAETSKDFLAIVDRHFPLEECAGEPVSGFIRPEDGRELFAKESLPERMGTGSPAHRLTG
jgi:hypothetical protein